MKSQKAIYIIGGGQLGLDVIRWAKELGLSTIVTDKNEQAPGLALADVEFIADAGDVDRHLEFAKTLQAKYEIVGVYCGNEIGVWTIHHLSKFLKLGHNTVESLENVLDKVRMKRIWEDSNIPSPHTQLIKKSKELEEIVRCTKIQIIVKPALGSGSRGVQIVKQGSDFAEVFNTCLHSVDGQGEVILETYIEGRSIDANGVFLEGKFFPAGILEKYITDFPNCLPIAGNDPADISKEEQAEVYSLLENGCRTLGLTFGPVKGDFIRTDKGYQALEVAPRFHGDVTTCNTLPFGSGINPVKFYFNYLATGEVKTDFLTPTGDNYAAWQVACLPPGKIKKSLSFEPDGDNTLSQITKVWFNQKCLPEIFCYTDTAKIPGYVCVHGGNSKDVEETLTRFWQDSRYEVEVNPEHFAWYEQLGKRIEGVGFKKESFGFHKTYK